MGSKIQVPDCVEERGTAGFYCDCIRQGQSPSMAEIFSMQQAPGTGLTDDVILSGIGTLEDQFRGRPDELKQVTDAAMKRGYRPKPTDYYMPSIAAGMGDPAAFVNHGQGKSHIKKVLTKRGWAGSGIVDIDAREPEHDPHTPKRALNPKIAKRIAVNKIKENPDIGRMKKVDLIADITAKHGYSKTRDNIGE